MYVFSGSWGTEVLRITRSALLLLSFFSCRSKIFQIRYASQQSHSNYLPEVPVTQKSISVMCSFCSINIWQNGFMCVRGKEQHFCQPRGAETGGSRRAPQGRVICQMAFAHFSWPDLFFRSAVDINFLRHPGWNMWETGSKSKRERKGGEERPTEVRKWGFERCVWKALDRKLPFSHFRCGILIFHA